MQRADTGKDPDAGKDWRQEEKGMTEDQMVGRHHHELSKLQEMRKDRGAWGHKESDMTEWLNTPPRLMTIGLEAAWRFLCSSAVQIYLCQYYTSGWGGAFPGLLFCVCVCVCVGGGWLLKITKSHSPALPALSQSPPDMWRQSRDPRWTS